MPNWNFWVIWTTQQPKIVHLRQKHIFANQVFARDAFFGEALFSSVPQKIHPIQSPALQGSPLETAVQPEREFNIRLPELLEKKIVPLSFQSKQK